MALIKVPENREKEMLDDFCEHSMFTFEGLEIEGKDAKESLKELEKLLRATGYKEKDFIAFWMKGSVMNKHYGLSGANAYPDDLTIVVIPNYYNSTVKVKLGARWFDDIVANNVIKQNAVLTNCEPDFDIEIE